MTNLILAALLAIAVALAAAPASGYKSGWTFYRRHNYVPPAQFRIPFPVTLKLWCGWIKGSNTITNILHSAAPRLVPEYIYLQEVKESGQVVAGITIAFLLVSAFIGFLYFLACMFKAMRGARHSNTGKSAVPAGLALAGLCFGFLNMAWSVACYITIACGVAIYTRRNLGATYVSWPDWCFWLAFFSGAFWFAASAVAFAERRHARRNTAAVPHGTDAKMTHNTTYDRTNGTAGSPNSGSAYGAKPGAVV